MSILGAMNRASASIVLVGVLLASAIGCARTSSNQTSASDATEAVGGISVEHAFPSALQSQLAHAGCIGDRAQIAELVRQGADPNYHGVDGITALMWSLHCNNDVGVSALLGVGADANARFGNTTPICFAAALDSPDALRSLLAHGGDPNAKYTGGSSALEVAFDHGMDHGDWRNYYALLDAGADINAMGRGATIAEVAASLDQFDKVIELMDRGYRARPLHLALLVQSIHPETMASNQITWAARVRHQLEESGVTFPVDPANAAAESASQPR
jgi:hypothetical protein